MKVSEIQTIIREIYYKKDFERGIHHTYLWFIEEVGELARALAKNDRENDKEEIADVFMWLVTLANILEIDLEMELSNYLKNEKKKGSK